MIFLAESLGLMLLPDDSHADSICYQGRLIGFWFFLKQIREWIISLGWSWLELHFGWLNSGVKLMAEVKGSLFVPILRSNLPCVDERSRFFEGHSQLGSAFGSLAGWPQKDAWGLRCVRNEIVAFLVRLGLSDLIFIRRLS